MNIDRIVKAEIPRQTLFQDRDSMRFKTNSKILKVLRQELENSLRVWVNAGFPKRFFWNCCPSPSCYPNEQRRALKGD